MRQTNSGFSLVVLFISPQEVQQSLDKKVENIYKRKSRNRTIFIKRENYYTYKNNKTCKTFLYD